ncbi:hypothetical protein AB0D78_05425 [Streptomyces avermitilis]|uniref:hypothetical protein n=1 Tax=Streptomyces avermitilis TaxID=33903 RepID=UPI0033F673D5
MRLGATAALLSAAIGALTVSVVGSAHAEDGPPEHTQESSPVHAEDLFHFKKTHRVKHFLFVDESSPAPVAAVPGGPLCSQAITATGGDADAGGGTATGGAATASGNTQTQTCNITVNLPVGSDQTVRRTSRELIIREDRKEALKKREFDRG